MKKKKSKWTQLELDLQTDIKLTPTTKPLYGSYKVDEKIFNNPNQITYKLGKAGHGITKKNKT